MGNRASPVIVAALLLGALALFGQFVSSTARAGERVALVIGNASYKEAPLRNPINDARAMAASLKDLGFEVISVENAGKETMERAIVEFTGRLDENSSGLFYYAGHGVQISGRNYLVPVDARIRSEREARIESVGVNLVLDELEYAGNRLNVVILDSCRNNPFERRLRGASRGLAAIDAGHGTLIAYATSPGSVALDGDGRNGLYTEELLRALRVPGLEVEEVFKQVRVQVSRRTDNQQIPWESSSLTGQFILNRPSPTASTTSSTENRNETLYWESVERNGTPEAYRAYLQQFPNGVFSSLAALRIDELMGKAAGSGGAPTATSSGSQTLVATASQPEKDSAIATEGKNIYQSSKASPITSGGGTTDTKPVDSADLPPYVIAVFPPAGKVWSWGGGGCLDASAIMIDIGDRVSSNDAFRVDYKYNGTLDKHTTERLRDLAWRNQGLRKRPNFEQIDNYSQHLDADAVLLYWWEVSGSYCIRKSIEIYLYDLKLQKAYKEMGTDRDIRALSDNLMGKFLRGRSFAQLSP